MLQSQELHLETEAHKEQRRCRPPSEPLPPCAVLFIAGLPVAVPGAGWKRPLEKKFGRFSARGKPRIRIARNTFNNTVGHGWIENVLLERATEAVAALDGVLKLNGHTVSVSLCVDRRDALCPKLSYAARKQLFLAPVLDGRSQREPLEQPTAERIAELLMLFATIGSGGTGGGGETLLPAVRLVDISAGEGLATAVFASMFAAVHAVESDTAQYAALQRNFSLDKSQDGETGVGSLATVSGNGKIHLHSKLDDALAALSGTASLLPRDPLFGFFQACTELGDVGETMSQTSDCTQWVAKRFCALLSARCDVVAALLPPSIDFDTLAASLVQPANSESLTDERPHPFKLEFSRPSYTAEGAPRSGVWQNWQLVIVTAALPSLASPATGSVQVAEMIFGNARLDALVQALLGFHNKYSKEHRPFFYDWEKQRTIQLSRWKGAKLAHDHNGLTLRELRAARSEPDAQSGSDGTEATIVNMQKPQCTSSSNGVGAILSEPHIRQCRLVWVLIVDGGTCDRKASSSRKASWVGFDKGYRLRRDALARSVTAALWANPASTADCYTTQAVDRQRIISDHEGPPRLVHADSECHIIYEQTGELLSISSDFAQSWRRGGPPTEALLLKAFDDAVRDASSPGGPGSTDKFVPGLTVQTDTTTVAEATARILTVSGLHMRQTNGAIGNQVDANYAVVELHEDKKRFLPVYSAPSLADQAKELEVLGADSSLPRLDALMMVLGCVQDHSNAVANVVETCLSELAPSETARSSVGVLEATQECGRSTNTRLHLAVNVGPVSEFSSKVIHLLQAHHSAQRLLPAVTMQLQNEAKARSAERDGQTARHVRLGKLASSAQVATIPSAQWNSDSSAAPKHCHHVPLHFWVWFDGVQLAHLPTTEECKRVTNPTLATNHRSTVWRVPNVVLAAFARSHGAYDNVKLSLVLEDVVITVDSSLVTKYITERGWGALTEHHTLVALRDAIDAASPQAPVLAKSFEQAVRQAMSKNVASAAAASAASEDSTTLSNRFVLLNGEEQHEAPTYSLAERLYKDRPSREDVNVPVAQPSAGASASAITPDRYHFLLLPAAGHRSASEMERVIRNAVDSKDSSADIAKKQVLVVSCSTQALSPTAVAEPVRTIIALQAHNNCGALAPAVDEVMEQSACV